MRKPQSPCLDCADREPGCHGRCEKYKDFRRDVDAYEEKHRADLRQRYAGIAIFSPTKHRYSLNRRKIK